MFVRSVHLAMSTVVLERTNNFRSRHCSSDAHDRRAGAFMMSARPKVETMPNGVPDERTLLALIRHMGRTLDDLENLRIRHDNRRGAFERDYDMVLPPDEVMESLLKAEHEAQRELIRLWRQCTLAPWAKSIRGVGEKSIARLIAEIGDPATRTTVSQLWAYCGYDPTRQRRKGMSQDDALACGNSRAKTRCFLIAESLLKSGVRKTDDGDDRYAISPHGELYLSRRQATAVSHPEWTPGHSHADALRIVAKTFLRDLWIASRRKEGDDQCGLAGGMS